MVSVLAPPGLLGEKRIEQQIGDLSGRAEFTVPNARLTVNTEPHSHRILFDMEQRLVGAGQGAPVESQAERSGGVVGLPRNSLGLVDVGAGLDGRACDLEDRQIAGDAATVAMVVRTVGGDVVTDGDDADVDSFVPQFLCGQAEVQDVAGVIAEAEDDAASVLGVAHHRVHLGRRR